MARMYQQYKAFAMFVMVCAILFAFCGGSESFAQKNAQTKPKRSSPPQAQTIQSTSTATQAITTRPLLFAETMFRDSNLTKQWKKLDSCLNKGLPKSALEFAEKILAEARKTKNVPHTVKAILTKSALQAELDEKGEETFVHDLQAAIQELQRSTPAQSVPAQGLSAENVVSLALLRSALAEYYWLYFQQNRWKIQNRTARQADNSTSPQNADNDYRAWDARQFVKTVRELHFAALGSATVLQQTPVGALDLLLTTNDTDADSLRPTLYDLLAHRALQMLNNTATTLPTPEEEFEISTGAGFTTMDEFVRQALSSPDADDWKYRTMLLYRDLLAFHAPGASPDALLDANLLRLKFVKEHAFGSDVDAEYLRALERDAVLYKASPVAAEYWCAIAQEYFDKGDYIKARSILAKAFDYPQSLGSRNGRALEQQILAKELSIQTGKTVLPGTPFLVSVGFRNCETVYFRLLRVTKKDAADGSNESENLYDDAVLKQLLEQKPVLQWEQTLPLNDSNGVNDYKRHITDVTTPVKPDSMTLGRYILLASPDESFSLKKNHLAWTRFTATRLALVHQEPHQYSEAVDVAKNTLIVTDAETGAPQSGVTVRLLRMVYDYTTYKNRETLVQKLLTDNNGFCDVAASILEQGVFVEVSRGNDVLRDGTNLYRSYSYNAPARDHVLLFTDRSLYRPGQTLYFKGIAHFSDPAKPDHYTLRGRQFTATLRDANSREIGKQTFTTNEYGSFQGTFTIPLGVLNGQMTLHTDEGGGSHVAIRVEEYKRPKFEATLERPKGLVRLEEIVKVVGNAKNYAGAVVDGASVQYRVVREARFPYWRGAWWMPEPESPQKEIARGRTMTDAKGNFTIEFPAAPDKSLSPETLPIFTYTVFADVTDISGETHTAEMRVSVGYVAVSLLLNVPERIEKATLVNTLANSAKAAIHTANLNGESISTQGTVRVERLHVPTRIFRSRILPQPDRFILSAAEFAEAFPHDAYKRENERDTWKAEREILNTPFATDAQGAYLLGSSGKTESLKNLVTGVYRITASVQDVSGKMLEQVRYFTVFDTSAKQPAVPIVSEVIPLKVRCRPSETASFLVSSSYPDARIFMHVKYQGTIAENDVVKDLSQKQGMMPLRQWLTLKNEQRLVRLPVPENFRGNVRVGFFIVRNNRFTEHYLTVNIPWTNKELSVEKQTFRDKTRPGSKEEWTLTVRGENAEKLGAELVATMYDASLEALTAEDYVHSAWRARWQPFLWQAQGTELYMRCQTFGAASAEQRGFDWNEYYSFITHGYRGFDFSIVQRALYRSSGYGRGGVTRSLKRAKNGNGNSNDEVSAEPQMYLAEGAPPPPPAAAPAGGKPEAADEQNADTRLAKGRGEDKPREQGEVSGGANAGSVANTDLSGVQARINLNETAFFLPQLQTNDKGEVVLKFTIPEALTRWRMLAFAHTPDLKSGALEAETITQKELMLLPNMPRFLREGDNITLPVKIANLTNKPLRGTAELKLFDALTMRELSLGFKQQAFTAEAAQSSVAQWSLTVPEGLQAVVYRVVAKAGNVVSNNANDNSETFSDGEEAALPVLPNRMLVTETLPINIRGNEKKTLEWKKLAEAASKSGTLRHQRLTLEMTSNPAWYAIQALPMLMEYQYDCTEQLWNRLYANAIATHLANSKPRIKAVFDSWKGSKESLLSNLEKNQELKALLLEETPWVLNAQDETERKRRVGLLFDLNRMQSESSAIMQKLLQRLTPNGSMTWFPGMPESRFITQYVLAGIGHLERLGVYSAKSPMLPSDVQSGFQTIAERGREYIDREIATEYERLKTRNGFKSSNEHLSYDAIQYLYARSFFAEKPIPSGTREAFDFWKKQAEQYWTNQGIMGQCMIALALQRFSVASGDKKSNAPSELILKSLRERALKSDEMGMYWKQNVGGGGWWWYQAPIETQALAIEAFIEVAGNDVALKEVEEMKIWLLKQKQTQDWKTTKATAEACYALLLRGADWLESSNIVEVKLGKTAIDKQYLTAQGASIEAGTGYYKVSFGKGEITPEMSAIAVSKSDAGIAWGGVYWQYFERLDKITPATTPLSLTKKLYRQNTTAKGLELEAITDKTSLRVGDLVKVRVELRSDREMEYVHLKDMRGAGFEPITTLSGYKWQNGLGYYETMRDASANFFIGWLPRGVWVFEYALRVTHDGTFQNGITTIQSMYAPEFSSHSEGVTVRVGK